MKRNLLLSVFVLLTAVSALAQQSFGLMFGVNSTTSSAENVGWSVGGFLGARYDARLSGSLYLQPRLQLHFENNQYEGELWGLQDPYHNSFGVMLPVLASYKINLPQQNAFRLNAGPYVQYDIFGQSTGRQWWHQDMSEKLTYGLQAGIEFDFNDMFVMADYRHSLHRSVLNFNGFENAIQVGIGFKF